MYRKTAIRFLSLGLALIVGLYFAYTMYVVFILDSFPGDNVGRLYFFFVVVLAVWFVEVESRDNPDIYRPYEHGLLAWMFWFAYLPYYLVKTRGIRGIGWLLGLLLALWIDDAVYVLYWLSHAD